jgi:hypothetical protein
VSSAQLALPAAYGDRGPNGDPRREMRRFALASKRGQCLHERDERLLGDIVDVRVLGSEHGPHDAMHARRDGNEERVRRAEVPSVHAEVARRVISGAGCKNGQGNDAVHPRDDAWTLLDVACGAVSNC